MSDFTKLAAYLESFQKGDPNYDIACFIKAKIGKDTQDNATINNGEEDDLGDNDITMSTPEQQSNDNTEGKLMNGAFEELDALNEIKDREEDVKLPEDKAGSKQVSPDGGTPALFGDNALNQKQASLFTVLQTRVRK